MQVEWYGQSAYRLATAEVSVVIDPFGDMSPMRAHGRRFDYPEIAGVSADLVLVTHEHLDHNAVDVIAGDPVVLRSTAGRLPSPIGEITAVASEHDDCAGTERGPNTLFAFTLAELRVAHLGDLGQRELRDEQAAALGPVDLLFVPIGGGPTIDGAQAAAIARRLQARWIVPMHYRTHRIDFLEPPDAFLQEFSDVRRLDRPTFETQELNGSGVTAVAPTAP